jgi:predicted small metal-binding protein
MMRMLMNISFPVNEFNRAVVDGSVGKKIKTILQQSNPEAVYFTEQFGQRAAVAIVNVEDPSQVPEFAEPWFLQFNASVEFRVAMTPEDLEASHLEELGRKCA